MTYPSRTSHRSYGGGNLPTYLASSIPATYSAGQTFTVADASSWYEVDENGDVTVNPLGTSGPFTLTVDADTALEEKILCSSVVIATGVVTVWTDGALNGRGDDATSSVAHNVGSSSKLNVYPLATATDQLQLREGVIQAISNAATALNAANTAESHAQTALTNAAAAQSTANTAEGHAQTALTNAATAQSTANTAEGHAQTALTNAATAQSTANTAEADAQTAISNAATAQATANAKVASVAAGDATITIGGTSTAPTVKVTPNTFDAYGAAASKVASVTSGNSTISIGGTATNPTVSVNQSNLVISESQVTNLTTDLANKVNTSAVGAANGVASLDGSGLVPSSQIPPIAITETFVVNSQAAMLALTAQVGDVAVRTDINTTFILQASPASTLGNWVQILSPGGGVTSIATSSPITGGTITSTGTIGIQSASTTQSGAVQLTDSVSSTSTTTAATSNSVKTAYDLASTANTAAATAQSTANAKVASVTAGDSSITIGGTSTAPTVAVASSGVTAGSYGNSYTVPSITVDSKGRVTAASATRILNTNATITSATTLSSGIYYPCDTTAGAFTVTLPSTSTSGGSFVAIQLKAGTAALTIAANTGQTINWTAASIQLTSAGQSVFLTYTSGGATWNIVGASAVPAGASGFAAGGDLTGTYPNPSVIAGSTTQAGKLQLTDSTSSTSTSTAATPNAVKSAYDLANTANTTANAAAPKTTTISTTAPLAGGGDLSANRTLSIADASTTAKGAVQLTDSVSTTSSTLAATATAVKSANDNADTKVASVSASTGITVGGTATAPTVAISTLSPSPAGTYGTASAVPALTVNAQGQVTSVTTNTVNDTTKLPLAGGTMSGTLNMGSQIITTANGVAINTSSSGSSADTLKLTDRSSSGSIQLRAASNGSGGGLELINNAFNASVFQVKDSGAINVTGNVAMNSKNITGLARPSASGDALRAGDFSNTPGPLAHVNAFAIPILAWTVEPMNAGAASGPVSNRTYWQAIYIPYAMTVTGVVFSVSTIGSSITSSSIGLYDSTGTRLVQQSNANAGFGTASTGTVTVAFSSTYSITTPGVYWIGFHVQATTTPTLIRGQSANAAAVNINISATAGTLNFRSGYSGTGAIPASFPVGTPTLDVAPWLFGLY